MKGSLPKRRDIHRFQLATLALSIGEVAEGHESKAKIDSVLPQFVAETGHAVAHSVDLALHAAGHVEDEDDVGLRPHGFGDRARQRRLRDCRPAIHRNLGDDRYRPRPGGGIRSRGHRA